jgi:hypothetical protein
MKKFLVSVALAIAVVTGYVEALGGIAHIMSPSSARPTVSQSAVGGAHGLDEPGVYSR